MAEETTDELLAVKFPHAYHLFRDIEAACEAIEAKGGKGRIHFDLHGLDKSGKVIVKGIESIIKLFRSRD